MTMHAFDASTMIHALDNYPPSSFLGYGIG